MSFNFQEHPHNRYNPLLDEWVLVSPHRATRPWAGQIEDTPPEHVPQFDPTNPLCPGVERASGIVTENYTSTFTFPNDFPALLEEGPEPPSDGPLFQNASALGTSRVVCFHPRSDVHLGTMTHQEVTAVLAEWMRQLLELAKKYLWVQMFENRGAMMGCSNPHPHSQIWASAFLPQVPGKKDANQRKYFETYGRPMLGDYLEQELKKGERIVWQNSEWVVLVPYWAFWPFETMVLPKRQVQRMLELDCAQIETLAEALQAVVSKYDNMFRCSFPYSMGWHGAPTGPKFGESLPYWTFHGWFLPPLLRSATVKKFMVGYELLAQGQRDLTPEKAAKVLRDLPDKHYKLSST